MGIHQQGTVPVGPAGEQLSLRGTVAAVSRNEVYSFTKPVRDEIELIAGLGVAGDVHSGVTVKHRSRVAADPDQPNLRQVHLIRSELHDEVREAGYEVPAGGLGENVTTSGIDLLALPVGTILRFGPAPAADSAPAESLTAAPAGPAAATLAGPAAVAPAGSAAVGPAESPAAAPAEPLTAGPAGGAAAVVTAAGRVTLDTSAANAVAALVARLATDQSTSPGAGADAETDRDAATAQPSSPPPTIVLTGLRNPCQQINHYRPGLLKRVLRREDDGSLSRRAGVMAVVLHGGVIRPGAEIQVELPAPPYLPLDRV